VLTKLGWVLDRCQNKKETWVCPLLTPGLLPYFCTGKDKSTTCLICHYALVQKCHDGATRRPRGNAGLIVITGTSVHGIMASSLRHPRFGHTSMQNGNSHPI